MTQKIRDHEELQHKLNRYSDMLFKIAYLRLQNVQDAEDVVQEAFYQYIKRKEEFEEEEHEKAWLIKVTLNACRKVWRSAWNRRRSNGLSLYKDAEICHPEDEEILAKGTAPQGLEEQILAVESNRVLLAAVKELPAKYRDVIHLFYYEELSIREIGEVTGRKESTITSQLTRGRELLKKRLKEEYDFA